MTNDSDMFIRVQSSLIMIKLFEKKNQFKPAIFEFK